MKKFFSRIGKKLKGRRGDSIAEVLIALLISSVALVMLASMISSSSSMIDSSRKNIESYYSKASDELTGSGTPKFTGTAKLVASDSTVKTSYSVNYYVNDNINKHPVVTFEENNP